MDNNQLMAKATVDAMLKTIMADGIDVPDRILTKLQQMELETGIAVIKITVSMTCTKHVPAGSFPPSAKDEEWRWQHLRLCGDLELKKYADWPKVKITPPEPCYLLHTSDNAIVVEDWLKRHGFIAMSAQPFRCTLLEHTT
jgi:hypothetical protein